MLTQLSICNFITLERLEIEIKRGMTVVTGETGAGKSSLINALAFISGARADSRCVGKNAERAEVSACFDIQRNDRANDWLDERTLLNGQECILRRVINREGRSRAYINGTLSSLSELKALSELLIQIQGQHASLALLQRSNHRELLDSFANCRPLAQEVAQIAHEHQRLTIQLKEMNSQQQAADERIQLLGYQHQELEQLSLQDGELIQLENELAEHTHAEQVLSTCHQVTSICTNDDTGTVLGLLARCTRLLDGLPIKHPALESAQELLTTAHIQVEESVGELNRWADGTYCDAVRMEEINQRLSAAHELARKHRVAPEELSEKQLSLYNELESLQSSNKQRAATEQRLQALESLWLKKSSKLSTVRKHSIRKLEESVSTRLAQMGLPHGQLTVSLAPSRDGEITQFGLEHVELLISTNPDQPPAALSTVASGGELSRISLAIQIITVQQGNNPCLVFDEVDSGIGGGTAQRVGSTLKELGTHNQVLCVTHQPQVATQGDQHFQVEKSVINGKTSTAITPLQNSGRVQEIARMLGGIEITQSTLVHAKEMLSATG